MYHGGAPRGCGAAGSAPHWQCGGQGFESPQLHRVSRCTNRSRRGCFRWWGGCSVVGCRLGAGWRRPGLGDADDRPEAAGCGDGDSVDEGFDECSALVVGSAGDDVGDVAGDGGEGGGVGLGGFGVDVDGELFAASAELFGGLAQGGKAFGEGVFVEDSVLVGGLGTAHILSAAPPGATDQLSPIRAAGPADRAGHRRLSDDDGQRLSRLVVAGLRVGALPGAAVGAGAGWGGWCTVRSRSTTVARWVSPWVRPRRRALRAAEISLMPAGSRPLRADCARVVNGASAPQPSARS
jgi:hypothetical protein